MKVFFKYLEYCLRSIVTYFCWLTNTAPTRVKHSSDKQTLHRRVSHIWQYSVRTATSGNMSHVSTNITPEELLFLKYADKPAGAINWPCSIGVLCTMVTHLTGKLSKIVALCTIATRSTQKRLQIHFRNSTPHIFTRTQFSFIIKTTLLYRVEDHTTRTCFLPGVPSDTFDLENHIDTR